MAKNTSGAAPTPTLNRKNVSRGGIELEAPDTDGTIRLKDMAELPVPVGADGNDDVMYAVRFAGRNSGFYRASVVQRHETSLANPSRQFLYPKLSKSEARDVDPVYWEKPERNLIGRGNTVGFYVDAFKSTCYVDQRAAAATNHRPIVSVYLWCPHFEADHPGAETHSEHAAYRGLIEVDGAMELQPDDRNVQVNEDDAQAGWCPRCHNDTTRLESSAKRSKQLNGEAPRQD